MLINYKKLSAMKDLMKKRWRCKDYPNSPFGTSIITEDEVKFGIGDLNPNDYPHIFTELAWYKECPLEELPKYVKWVEDDFNEVFKVDHWEIDDFVVAMLGGNSVFTMCKNAFPATEQEYLTYKNK
jgi:hypothetical protein